MLYRLCAHAAARVLFHIRFDTAPFFPDIRKPQQTLTALHGGIIIYCTLEILRFSFSFSHLSLIFNHWMSSRIVSSWDRVVCPGSRFALLESKPLFLSKSYTGLIWLKYTVRWIYADKEISFALRSFSSARSLKMSFFGFFKKLYEIF